MAHNPSARQPTPWGKHDGRNGVEVACHSLAAVIRIVSALATTIVLSFIALQHTSADIGRLHPHLADDRPRHRQHEKPAVRASHFSAQRRPPLTDGGRSRLPAMFRQHPRSTTKQTRNGDAAIDVSSSTSPTGAGCSGRSTRRPARFCGRATISEYNDIAGFDLANQPCAGARTGSRRRSERQHDGHRRRDRQICGGSHELDPNPNTIVTDIAGRCTATRLYIATSSSGGGDAAADFPRQHDRARHPHTGRIIWQTFVLPDNGGVPGGFAGRRVREPAGDRRGERPGLRRGRAALHTAGHRHGLPGGRCRMAGTKSCFPPGAYFNSVVAFDLQHRPTALVVSRRGPARRAQLGCGGRAARRGARRGRTTSACGTSPAQGPTSSRLRHRTAICERSSGIGQKSGVYWALDARTGELRVEQRLVGHGDDPGGIQWGTAIRRQADLRRDRPQPESRVPYTLPSGETITGGSWAALDPIDRTRSCGRQQTRMDAPDLAAR